MPARYIFLLTLCEKFSSGEFGKVRPPPRQIGDEVMPARARPVPFWRHGFFVLCLTVSRFFWARVPWRALAWIGHHHLVHQRFVVVAGEHRVRRVDLGGGLPLIVEELELHQLAPFWTWP